MTKENEEYKRLIALIRKIAREEAYSVLDEHLAEDHSQKTPEEEEIENIE